MYKLLIMLREWWKALAYGPRYMIKAVLWFLGLATSGFGFFTMLFMMPDKAEALRNMHILEKVSICTGAILFGGLSLLCIGEIIWNYMKSKERHDW